MKRQIRRITDCMDCWERGWCFLFFEQWPDGTPRGIWLCSDCVDIKRGWRNSQATTLALRNLREPSSPHQLR